MKKAKKHSKKELDSVYILKLILFFVIGTMWVYIDTERITIPLPVGLPLGLWFASHDHFKIDRKIEYAVLIVAVLVSYFLPARFVLAF